MHIIDFEKITIKYNNITAINNLSFDVSKNEIVALLGPSGCGKSTILRAIAGFETVDSGKILINDSIATEKRILILPEKRQIGMVFQDFALFPHLSIKQNIAFGLKGGKQIIQKRVADLLKLIKMEAFGDRMPHEISGGQQQRVAVARALAPKPDIILLDEPFSSLDSALRTQLREEIRDIFKAENVSALIVTHDQAEAFEFADRIIVLKDGEKVQEGSPKMIYQSPVNEWCAKFVGHANFLDGELAQQELQRQLHFLDDKQQKDDACRLMVRPENVHIATELNGGLTGMVIGSSFVGESEMIKVKLNNGVVFQVKSNPLNFDHMGKEVGLNIDNYQVFPV